MAESHQKIVKYWPLRLGARDANIEYQSDDLGMILKWQIKEI